MSMRRVVPLLVLVAGIARATIDPLIIPAIPENNVRKGFTSLALTPDGSLAVTGGRDSTVTVWRLSDGARIWKLTGHRNMVQSVAVTPDGARIVSAGRDSTVRIWRLSDGALERTIPVPNKAYEVAAPVPPAGAPQLVIAGIADNMVYAWRVADGVLQATLAGHGGEVRRLIVAPLASDGTQMVVSSGTEGAICAWRLPTGDLLWKVADFNPAPTIAFSPAPNGALPTSIAVYESNWGRVRFLDPADGSTVAFLNTGSAGDGEFAVSPDGRYLAMRANHLEIWRISDGLHVRSLSGYPSPGYYSSIAFTPGGDRVVLNFARDDGNALAVFDFAGLVGHQQPSRQVLATTTWTKAASPYHVVDTLFVPTGNTLTIEPGVDVVFDEPVPFIVRGSIHAIGTATDSIRFLAGDLKTNNAADYWHGIRISGGAASVFDHVRISGAWAVGPVDHIDTDGGGLYVGDAGTTVHVTHSTISGNASVVDGGGFCVANGAAATVEDTRFSGNFAMLCGGAIAVSGGTLVARRCDIGANRSSSYGGGLLLTAFYNPKLPLSPPVIGSATIEDCTFEDNRAAWGGGGAFIADGEATMTRCRIAGNSIASGKGGGLFVQSALTLDHCIVENNNGHHFGGGIAVTGNLTLSYCRVINNYAYWKGGGLIAYRWGSTPTVTATRCTFAGNVAGKTDYPEKYDKGDELALIAGEIRLNSVIVWGEIFICTDSDSSIMEDMDFSNNYSPVTVSAAYSDIKGGWFGDGNIDEYPLFADSTTYALAAGSPCIDMGDPVLAPDPDGSRADIGAVRLARPTAIAPVAAQTRFVLHPNAPNPFNPSTVIRFSLAGAGDVRLAVYDVSGRLVRVLLAGPMIAGAHEVVWDGRDDAGRHVASGVYLYRLASGRDVETRRMVLLR